MFMLKSLAAGIVLLFAWSLPLRAQTIGAELPPWTPGVLDIHQINTGQGNAAFFRLPDGTTLLVDAGYVEPNPPQITPPKPDGSRTPGQWIARYILHMLGNDRATAIDYGYLTHFHGDHMGALNASIQTAKAGGYKLTGITEVAEYIPIRKMIDRGWPDYNYPSALDDPMIDNYRAFLKWQIANKGMKVERLQPGRRDQIVLQHDAKKFPDFEVRNIAANGEVWTGVDTITREQFPALDALQPADYPTENMCSLAIRLSYGKFDYYTGGDMPGIRFDGDAPWRDVETPVAQAVGAVEAALPNHHGNRDSTNPFFVRSLRPQVWIIPVWSSDHPGHDVLDRMYSKRLYPGARDIFATNMFEANHIVIGKLMDNLKSMQGHIVIRVQPGGGEFHVIILDDSAETFRVKAVHGPYQSR